MIWGRKELTLTCKADFPLASLEVEPTQHFNRSTDCLLAWFDENLEIAEVEIHILQEQ